MKTQFPPSPSEYCRNCTGQGSDEFPSPADSVEVRLFGQLQICVRGQPCYIENKKARELLALLLAYRCPVKKAQAAELLWSGAGQQQAMDRLYQVLQAWRRDQVLQTYFPMEPRRNELELTDPACFCDLWEFEEAAAGGDLQRMAKAVELYTGPLLFQECYEWTAEREAFYDLRQMKMLDVLVSHFTNTGDGVKAAYYQKKIECI